MEENQNHNMEKRNEKNIYFTQFNFKLFLLFLLFFVSCSALAIWLFIIYLDGKDEYIYYIIIPIIILTFGAIITSFFPLFTKIIIDIENDLIIFKDIKILFCLNKTNSLNLSEIEQVIVEKNTNVHYEMNGTKYDGFNLVFKMKKDKELRVLNGEEDKNFESQKIFDFLRETLPKNIPVSSDFPTGVGYADYVLYDTDGKPLAVIEAKRTCKDVDTGAKQAKIYAQALKDKFGIMPVIFYTNGYQIYMVDGVGGPARRVFGYYSLKELHSLIVRRKLGAIKDTRVNQEISDRYFIQNACTAVCAAYSGFKRKALNVMATGTGKTRFAISISGASLIESV